MAERIVDLGCGTGENTAELARRFSRRGATLGLDSSPAMIDRALKLREEVGGPALRERLSFVFADIREFNAGHEHSREYSMIFSNAALQWLTEHREIFTRCFEALAPGGRMAVQVPANDHETAQVTLDALAHEEPWRAVLAGVRAPSATVAAPEFSIGCSARSASSVSIATIIRTIIRWARQPRSSNGAAQPCCAVTWICSMPRREPFIEALTARLERAYDTRGPLTFNFRRLFIWARRRPT